MVATDLAIFLGVALHLQRVERGPVQEIKIIKIAQAVCSGGSACSWAGIEPRSPLRNRVVPRLAGSEGVLVIVSASGWWR